MKGGWLVSLLVLTSLSAVAIGIPSDKRELSPGRSVTLEPAFFGIHFHRLLLMQGEQAISTQWPPLLFGVLRLWDSRTRWADVETENDVWRFVRLDHYVNEAQARGVKVLYTLGSTPAWASARPDEPCSYGRGCAAEPRSLDDWRDYVRTVAQRYRGRICCYELWNEPKFVDFPRDRGVTQFFSGSVADMVSMARIAREVLDEVDPEALLLTPGFVNGPDRLDRFLAAGGSRHVQAVAYHFYAWNDEDRMLREIDAVRGIMKKHGLQTLPLWSTEAGVEVHPSGEPLPPGVPVRIGREEAAARMVRQVVLAAFAGLDKYFYYAWDNDRSGMVDRAGRFLPARDAMLLVQRWLLGAQLERCERPAGRPTLCWGMKEGRHFAIAWNPDGAAMRQVQVPEGWRVVARQAAVPGWQETQAGAPEPTIMRVGANPVFHILERVDAS